MTKFLIQATNDVLPTPTNLAMLEKTEDPNCYQCGARGTLRHILSGCNTSLAEGRYRWRHDSVLREIAAGLEEERKKIKQQEKLSFINFVRPGQVGQGEAKKSTGLLSSGKKCDMKVDLDKKLVFSPEIVVTRLRPDIVLWSRESKKVVMIELTVPWEERMEEAHELKRSKYAELQAQCIEKGWQTWVLPVEVGCRGFPGKSVWNMFRVLGIGGSQRKKTIKKIGEAAEKASCWLWYKRSDINWGIS